MSVTRAVGEVSWDEELIDTGSTASFEALYRSRFPRLLRVAHILTGSNTTAEEVVQDAFLALYPRFTVVADPDAYLYRSVVNGCRATYRRRRPRSRISAPTPGSVRPPAADPIRNCDS